MLTRPRARLRFLRRRGVVLGLSGGIDSSVSAALAVAAFGAEKVLGVLMPERDSVHKRACHKRAHAVMHRDHICFANN